MPVGLRHPIRSPHNAYARAKVSMLLLAMSRTGMVTANLAVTLAKTIGRV
jgi:hypothetical protein